jgi:hypothetical protein
MYVLWSYIYVHKIKLGPNIDLHKGEEHPYGTNKEGSKENTSLHWMWLWSVVSAATVTH